MSLTKPEFNFEEGEVLLIDKPYEWSSFDVVKKIRNAIGFIKIGHAGTLDPLATGLLILCTGKMTKRINEFQDMEKEYEGELIIGKTTPSFDLETEIINEKDITKISEEDIKATVSKFIGKIMQVPPVYSAVKLGGKRMYKRARRGEDIKLEAKEIHIKDFIITSIELPAVRFRVVCSKGTYIRSLVRDFGEALQVGAYMSSLKRTRIGHFHINDSDSIEGMIQKIIAGK
ncbi:MAG: tRNA pseudouridine(55) synthase TruB [Cytophagaceae bacterium]|nr:tRNA pseudouridine(55) synthase TruB [Cytophagaceae bacterium]